MDNNGLLPPHINSAWALHNFLESERLRASQEGKIQNSILAMNEASHEQVALISALIEGQKRMHTEKVADAKLIRKSNKTQHRLNIYVIVISTLSLVISVIQLYQDMISDPK